MTDRERQLPEHEHADLVGAYVADALPDDERDAFERHLAACPECTHETAELASVAATIGAGVAAAPPAGLRDRVLAEVRATPQVAHTPRPADTGPDAAAPIDLAQRRASRRPVPRWAAPAAGLVAASLVAGVVSLGVITNDLSADLDAERQTNEQLTSLLADPDAWIATGEGPDGAVGRVLAAPTHGDAVFVTDGLAAAPDGRTYQLWLIGESIEPAGLFSVDDAGRALSALAIGIGDADVVGVTIEPEGGSDQPTTDPLMVIELAG